MDICNRLQFGQCHVVQCLTATPAKTLAGAVGIPVRLSRIGDERTVIGRVREAIAVQVGVEDARIDHQLARLGQIQEAVAVLVARAVADDAGLTVEVGNRRQADRTGFEQDHGIAFIVPDDIASARTLNHALAAMVVVCWPRETTARVDAAWRTWSEPT